MGALEGAFDRRDPAVDLGAVVKLLLAAGADPWQTDNEGNSRPIRRTGVITPARPF